MRRLLLILAFVSFPLSARVVRVDIAQRTDLANGRYERLTGKVYYALDPSNPHNRAIVDLDRAPRNAAGEVEFSADVAIIRPKHGSDATFIDIVNRGGGSILNPEGQGDFLLRHGFSVAAVGWQFDVRPDPKLLHLYAPVTSGISGKARSDFIVTEKTLDHPLGHVIGGQIGGTGYPVSDPKDAVLTERDSQLAERRTIPRKRWRFTDPNTVHLDTGFVPGRIYEVIYTAKDPAVVGTGFAAVRDFVSYLKHDPNAAAAAQRVYGFGISQSGRFLRHFVYQGFNADEQGRQVFDGTIPVVAGAGRGNFNHRLAQPSRDAEPLSPLFYPVDIPPFADNEILADAVAEKVVPKIMYVNTSYEFWSRGESLTYTTQDASREVELPPNVRLYTIAGMSHIGGPFPPVKFTSVPEFLGANLANPSNYWPVLHGAFLNLDAWVRDNVEPPPSRYPHIADGTLVPASQLAVKAPVQPYEPYRVDLGLQWLTGITSEPPRVSGTYPVLVPQVDKDGNELGGIRLPWIAVPVARWTGWNPRDPSIGFPNDRIAFVGSWFPFTKARIAELYPTFDAYFGRYGAAALALANEKYIVADDMPFLLTRGRDLWDVTTK